MMHLLVYYVLSRISRITGVSREPAQLAATFRLHSSCHFHCVVEAGPKGDIPVTAMLLHVCARDELCLGAILIDCNQPNAATGGAVACHGMRYSSRDIVAALLSAHACLPVLVTESCDVR